ncbi:MAG: AAA family ATPase [Porticoccaceae bacterium]
MQDAHDLGLIVDSRVPLVVLETHEEPRAIDLLLRVARQRDKPLFQWTLTDGLRRSDFGLQLAGNSQYTEPEAVLSFLKERAEPGYYVLCDFHPWLQDEPKNVRLLKDIALRNNAGQITVILLSHRLQLPPELSRLGARFSMSLPNDEQILTLIREEAKHWAQGNGGRKVKTDNGTLQQLVANLKGLTQGEVRHLVRGAIIDDGAITDTDLPEVNRAKFKLMDLEGVLSYEYDTEKFAAVGGMDNLKAWLEARRNVFAGERAAPGIESPRGILLLGVQGGGKSLAAKAVAGLWQVPLLRLDMGALYNKFHGETERNLRESLALAEKMSPCVLWIDEIEKGISGDSADSGTSQRVLGTLLTWLAEKREPVFVVATANDIARLPPELVRKGRLDELFFVDLPDATTREAIFSIHLGKRELDVTRFQLTELVVASEGFTGAEIEQAVVAALYSALAQNEVVSQSLLLAELAKTAPLSLVMAEKLAQLRQWASERNLVRV